MSRKKLTTINELSVSPVYLSARSAIIAPEQAIMVTHYSLKKWLPRLGADRWSLVQFLRGMCINAPRRDNGIKRVVASWRYLAECLQVHEETIASWLKHEVMPDDKPWRRIIPTDDYAEYLSLFIPRLRYAYETTNGKTRRVGFLLEVLMEDPIAPEDEIKLAQQVDQLRLQQGSMHLETYRIAPQVNPSQIYSPGLSGAPITAVNSENTDLPTSSYSDPKRFTPSIVNRDRVDSPAIVKQYNSNLPAQVMATDSGLQGGKSDETTNNVNKLESLINQLKQFKDQKRNYQQILEPIITLTEELLDDYHSTAMLYKVSKLLFPDHMNIYILAVEQALVAYSFDETLNKGAIFVKTLREMANQANIDLGFRKTPAIPEITTLTADLNSEATEVNSFDAPVEEIIWAEVLSVLRGQMTRAMFNSAMQGTNLVGKVDDYYIVQVATDMAKDWLDNRLKNVVERALSSVIGSSVRVQFRL